MTADNNKIEYLSDEELFMIWKFLNGKRIIGSNRTNIHQLTPMRYRRWFAFIEFFRILGSLGIEKEVIVLDSNTVDCAIDLLKEIESLNKSSANLVGNKSLVNVENISSIVVSKGDKITGSFDINLEISKKNKEKISRFINNFIEAFINDKLHCKRGNYCYYN